MRWKVLIFSYWQIQNNISATDFITYYKTKTSASLRYIDTRFMHNIGGVSDFSPFSFFFSPYEEFLPPFSFSLHFWYFKLLPDFDYILHKVFLCCSTQEICQVRTFVTWARISPRDLPPQVRFAKYIQIKSNNYSLFLYTYMYMTHWIFDGTLKRLISKRAVLYHGTSAWSKNLRSLKQ